MDHALLTRSAQLLPSFSVSVLVVAPLVYLIGSAIYNLFLHPLARYPGPLLCRVSKLPWDYWQWIGRLPQVSAALHAKYGEAVRIAPNELIFANAQAWADIYGNLRGKEMWPRHPNRVPQGSGTKSILNTAGAEHARFRRLLSHAFSEKGLQEQQGLITKYIDLFIGRIGEFAKSGDSMDVAKWFHMVGFDVISDLGWNEPFNCVENGRPHEWMETFATTTFDTQLKFLFREHGIFFLAPFLIPKRLQMDRLKNFKYARKRVEDRIRTGSTHPDFWDRILIKSANDNASGEGLTKNEMMVAAVTLVGTGSHTISTLLTGMVHFLGNNPQCMRKCVEEIRTAYPSADQIDLVSIYRLKYLTACLQETMRLYPPVVTMLWRVPPAGGAMVCDRHVPEGTSVNISMLGIAHNPAYFHRPKEFVPERFLADTPESKLDNQAPYHPFSLGAMNCLGQNLANAESRLILVKMFYEYDLEIDRTQTRSDWLDQKSWGVFVKHPLFVKWKSAKC